MKMSILFVCRVLLVALSSFCDAGADAAFLNKKKCRTMDHTLDHIRLFYATHDAEQSNIGIKFASEPFRALNFASFRAMRSTRTIPPHSSTTALRSQQDPTDFVQPTMNGDNPIMISLVRFRGGAGVPSTHVTPPPLTSWIGAALTCGLSYALYNLFIKRASSLMDPLLGGVLLQCVAAILGTVLWLATRSSNVAVATATTRSGIVWSMAAGLAVGLAEILSFVISSRGVPATKSIPVVVGGSVWFGTLLARLWLRERISAKGWLGVIAISIGIALVGMDPSSNSVAH